jgi:sulfofructose kinase
MVQSPILLFVGCATLDSIASVGEFPSADSRTIAAEFITAGGGPAATAAVTAARLGARTAFAGVIGNDEEGDRILAGLAAEGVDISCVVRSSTRASGASLIIVSDGGASRAIVTRPVPPLEFASHDVFRATVESAAWVHVDHLGWSAVRALQSGIRLSVDAGNPIPDFDPSGVALYVPTIERLRAEFGTRLSEPELVQTAIDRGARAVVATDGANGAWVHNGTGSVAHVPSVPTRIVSTLGAGDVFHGAILAAVAAGQDLMDAVALANQVAAESCTGLDGRSKIPRQYLTVNPAPPCPVHTE